MEQELNYKSLKYLCMSYNKYIIMRNKLSNACSKQDSDNNLRNKLMEFIRLHPDHELKRQTIARDNTTNIEHKNIHNAKIADLTEPASKMYDMREIYKQVKESMNQTILSIHTSRMINEKEVSRANKELKLNQSKANNIINIALHKLKGESIRIARAEKRKSL